MHIIIDLHIYNMISNIISHRIHGAAILMVTWIPSIYPSHVSINIPAPWIRHGYNYTHTHTHKVGPSSYKLAYKPH